MEQWLVLNKKADFKAIGEKYSIDQVTARIIRNREMMDDNAIWEFLYGGIKQLNNPHLLKDADLLVDILIDKIKQKKNIRVIGDYDIDGVMSTYILKSALLRCGANVSVKIPDRVKDGYGLNIHLVEDAKNDGIDTILTCDNGISAISEIAYAKEMQMTVLVTDHHEIPYIEEQGERIYQCSQADAIVNPHQKECTYPYKELCGAAVAWKIVCILFEKMGIPNEEALEYLENVAFATVGDVMNLTGENRILVKEGLKRIQNTKNQGMKALIGQCKIKPGQIDAFHFGFVLGPCINASGRLDTAQRALELLFEKEEQKALQIANELVILNEERKSLTIQGVEEAKRIYEENGYDKDSVLVIYLPDVHESIAGIIAGRIREAYYKPVFILTKSEDGVKGSGRSIEEYSMYEKMCKCQDLFIKFGGHPMAAGLSMTEENIDEFRRRMNEDASLTKEELTPKIRIDVPMTVDYVTPELIREFSILQPFGKGNSKPVFADRNLKVLRMWQIGKERKFYRLVMKSQYGTQIQAIYFGDAQKFQEYLIEKYGEEEFAKAAHGQENQITLSIVYYPKMNSYNGNEEMQFEILYYR